MRRVSVADRRRLLCERQLLGGVVGAWTQQPDGSIAVDVPIDLGVDTQALIDAEVRRLQSWLGPIRVKWRYPTPATKRLLA